jgi:hypothetical protein
MEDPHEIHAINTVKAGLQDAPVYFLHRASAHSQVTVDPSGRGISFDP